MAKKLFLIFLLLLAAVSAFYGFTARTPEKTNQLPVASPTAFIRPSPVILKRLELNYQDQPLIVYLQKISPQQEIKLIANFSEKISGQSLAEKNACSLAINGGFYTKENKPLGLFITDGKLINKEQKSIAANGFFWQDKQKSSHISSEPPSLENVSFALQSGPLFILPISSPVDIANDKPSRRSLLATDITGNLYAAVIFSRENKFSGPRLADVPLLLSQAEIQQVAALKKVINLDGGSASFFYSRETTPPIILSELMPIGSLLCLKK